MSQRDWHEHYDLWTAFRLLGGRLYGSEWQDGNEIHEPETSREEIDDLDHCYDALESQIQEAAAKIESLKAQKSSTVKADEIEAFQKQIEQAWSEQAELLQAKNRLPDRGASRENELARWTRRSTTEKQLLDGILSGKLSYHFPSLTHIDNRPWEGGHNGCRYDILLSVVWFPRKLKGEERRFAVRLDKDRFDDWIETLIPINPDAFANLSPQQKARAIIERDDKTHVAKPMRRDDYIEMLMMECEGLSKEAAKTAWRAYAPDRWKHKGRPKNG